MLSMAAMLKFEKQQFKNTMWKSLTGAPTDNPWRLHWDPAGEGTMATAVPIAVVHNTAAQHWLESPHTFYLQPRAISCAPKRQILQGIKPNEPNRSPVLI